MPPPVKLMNMVQSAGAVVRAGVKGGAGSRLRVERGDVGAGISNRGSGRRPGVGRELSHQRELSRRRAGRSQQKRCAASAGVQ